MTRRRATACSGLRAGSIRRVIRRRQPIVILTTPGSDIIGQPTLRAAERTLFRPLLYFPTPRPRACPKRVAVEHWIVQPVHVDVIAERNFRVALGGSPPGCCKVTAGKLSRLKRFTHSPERFCAHFGEVHHRSGGFWARSRRCMGFLSLVRGTLAAVRASAGGPVRHQGSGPGAASAGAGVCLPARPLRGRGSPPLR